MTGRKRWCWTIVKKWEMMSINQCVVCDFINFLWLSSPCAPLKTSIESIISVFVLQQNEIFGLSTSTLANSNADTTRKLHSAHTHIFLSNFTRHKFPIFFRNTSRGHRWRSDRFVQFAAIFFCTLWCEFQPFCLRTHVASVHCYMQRNAKHQPVGCQGFVWMLKRWWMLPLSIFERCVKHPLHCICHFIELRRLLEVNTVWWRLNMCYIFDSKWIVSINMIMFKCTNLIEIF